MVGQINKPEITTIQHDKYTDLDVKIHRLMFSNQSISSTILSNQNSIQYYLIKNGVKCTRIGSELKLKS